MAVAKTNESVDCPHCEGHHLSVADAVECGVDARGEEQPGRVERIMDALPSTSSHRARILPFAAACMTMTAAAVVGLGVGGVADAVASAALVGLAMVSYGATRDHLEAGR